MSHIIIQSDEQKKDIQTVIRQFGGNGSFVEHREFAECIAAKSREAQKALRRMEGRR